MPAPRACRSCGSALPPSVRWCSLCLTPVSEWSARDYDPGSVAEGHRIDHDPAGHWSRWEKSATTMGPRGRVYTSAAIAAWLIAGFFFEPLVTWICQVALLAWVLAGIWRKGWAIPSAPDGPKLRLTEAERRSLVPHYSDWQEASRRTKAFLVGGIALAAAFWFAWTTGDPVRQGILALGLTISIGVPVLYQLVKPM